MDVLGQFLVEQLDVEPELLGVRVEVVVAEALLVLIEKVVHLPEAALGGSSLGGLGGLLGVGV